MSDRVDAFYEALVQVDRPEVWIDVADREAVSAEFDAAHGPLAGLLLAVKNNVDVEGYPTTAACPDFATSPAADDAQVVARLRAAGATVVGTTNMDQFATGLVGQRSPYGGVRNAHRHEFASGGSSSGSAVAVALGLADIAIGTDTAGSGRVPAAFQGIVGIKPTLGLVSTEGVVPACRSWDAVTIMARDLDTADVAMGVMAGGDGTRPIPSDIPLAAPPKPIVAIPADLPYLAPDWANAFDRCVERLRSQGVEIRPIPFASFVEAARMLYDSALVAERHASVGAFVDSHADSVDPVVGQIISRAAGTRRRRWSPRWHAWRSSDQRAWDCSTAATRCWCRRHRSTRRSPRCTPIQWASTPGWAPTPTSPTCSTCAVSRSQPAPLVPPSSVSPCWPRPSTTPSPSTSHASLTNPRHRWPQLVAQARSCRRRRGSSRPVRRRSTSSSSAPISPASRWSTR